MGYRALFVAVLAFGSAVAVAQSPPRAQQPKTAVTVYKNASCGCCKNWVEHLRAAGFDVTAIDVENIGEIKGKYGVPTDIASCHTAVVDGYVVEGHVPSDVVQRFLRERPQVVGIATPGMPVGSPGMEDPSGRREPYNIVAFDKSGKQTVYDRR